MSRPIHENLRFVISGAGIMQKDFAAICGLSPEHLSRILNGWSGIGELSKIKIKHGLKHYNSVLYGKNNNYAKSLSEVKGWQDAEG